MVDSKLHIKDVLAGAAVVVFTSVVVGDDAIVGFCGFCVELGGKVVVPFGSVFASLLGSAVVNVVRFSVVFDLSLDFTVADVVDCSVVLAFVPSCSVGFVSCLLLSVGSVSVVGADWLLLCPVSVPTAVVANGTVVASVETLSTDIQT